MKDSLWDDLLSEFRALGGTAENVRLGRGALGRGLFPIDPAKPVAIHIPENLLVAAKDMIFENNALRVAPTANVGERERAWLERYQAVFSWGGDGGAEVRRIFESAQALPEELRHDLLTKHRCGLWFQDVSEELIQRSFFASRYIEHKNTDVVMPIIELANHGLGTGYETTDGVSLRGTFAGEITVRYANLDPYGLFVSWGFTASQPLAFSIALSGTSDSTNLHIKRRFGKAKDEQRGWRPEIATGNNEATLSFLLIGNQLFPRIPKGIFYQEMRDREYSGFEEAFDKIQHANRLHFLNLLDTLDGIELPIARVLRTMARYQLRAMSYCFGVRSL